MESFFASFATATPNNPTAIAIHKATSELRLGPDWGLNLEICDLVTSRRDGPKEAAAALKTRLGSRNPKIVIVRLTRISLHPRPSCSLLPYLIR